MFDPENVAVLDYDREGIYDIHTRQPVTVDKLVDASDYRQLLDLYRATQLPASHLPSPPPQQS